MEKRLYRSRTGQVIGGVCGGLANYLAIDPTIVRLIFILLALGSGTGLIIYFILWVIIPYEGEGEAGGSDTVRAGADEMADRMRGIGSDMGEAWRRPQSGLLIGGALVLVGLVFLVDNLNIPWLRWLNFDMLWPLVLVGAGVALLLRRNRN